MKQLTPSGVTLDYESAKANEKRKTGQFRREKDGSDVLIVVYSWVRNNKGKN